jgi:hypothetical protein
MIKMARIGVQILQSNISLMPNNRSFIVLVNKRYMNTGIRMTIHNSQINIHNVNWIYSVTLHKINSKTSAISKQTLAYHGHNFICIISKSYDLSIKLVPELREHHHILLQGGFNNIVNHANFRDIVPMMINEIKNTYAEL